MKRKKINECHFYLKNEQLEDGPCNYQQTENLQRLEWDWPTTSL